MFVRSKKSGRHTYLQIVESRWEAGKVRQQVIGTLGRSDRLVGSGDLERLLASMAKFVDHAMVIGTHREGQSTTISAERIGLPLIFERLWRDIGCRAVLERLLGGRKFEFAVERAVFLTVLHRLVAPGSDRAADKWQRDYRIDGAEELALHHLYRTMSWLGEELADQTDHTHGPRTTKDLIEEGLFRERRDLFTDLSVVFFDTTSFYFEGEGGETLGEFGHSKDHRPDRHQMILAVITDDEGRPVCSEMWPGNTADVTALLPVVDRLRRRFGVNRVCVVADRGMISADTIKALEDRRLEYILGARERTSREIQDKVLPDMTQPVSIEIPRSRPDRQDIELAIRETVVDGRRYITCINEAEAAKDAAARAAVLEQLQRALKAGDKALLANRAYKRYLKTPDQPGFTIDPDRVTADARFDGLYVLRTNAKLSAVQVALQYRQLWKIEKIFRAEKSLLDTRPIFHQRDATIRGHVFCSFLALVLRKELEDRLAAKEMRFEWADIVQDLDRLQEVTVEQGGKRFLLRTATTGVCGKVFQATGVALPPTVRQVSLPPPQSEGETSGDFGENLVPSPGASSVTN